MSKNTFEREFKVGTIFYFSKQDDRKILKSGVIYEEGGKYTITTPISSNRDFMDTFFSLYPTVYKSRVFLKGEEIFEESKTGMVKLFSKEVFNTEENGIDKDLLDSYAKTPKKSLPHLKEVDILPFLQKNDYIDTFHDLRSFSERVNFTLDLFQTKGEKEKLLILRNLFTYSLRYGYSELRKEIENKKSDPDLLLFRDTELAKIITGLIFNGEVSDVDILAHILDKVKNLSRREQIIAILYSLVTIIRRELLIEEEDEE